jgi:hypothetical protein
MVKGPVRDVLARSGFAEHLGSRTHFGPDDAVTALTAGIGTDSAHALGHAVANQEPVR